MKSPSKKPAKPFMEVGAVYMTAGGEIQEIVSKRDFKDYPWQGLHGITYTDKGGWSKTTTTDKDLIARVSIRVIRRNPWLGGGK